MPGQAPEKAQERKVSIQDVIEMLGFGFGQATLSSMANGGIFLEGMILAILALIDPSPTPHLFMAWSGARVGIFSGALLGAALCGILAVKAGSSTLIISGYAVLTVFLMLLSFADNPEQFLECHLMVGLGLGLCQPAAMALMNELTPERWRLAMIATSFFSLAAGALLGWFLVLSGPKSILVWLSMGVDAFDHEWRLHVRLCAIPATLLFLFALLYIPDSPHMMARDGDEALSRDVLKRIRRFNGMEFVPCVFNVLPDQDEVAQAKSVIISHAMFVLSMIAAAMSFIMMGMFAILIPQVNEIAKNSNSMLATHTLLLIGLVVGSFILVLGTTCFDISNMKFAIMATTIICCISCMLIYLLKLFPAVAVGADELPLIAVIGVIACPYLVQIFVYKAAMDMQPLSCCVMGLAFVQGAGRLASVFFGCIYGISEGVRQSFFGVLSVTCLCCIFLLMPTYMSTWDKTSRAPPIESDITGYLKEQFVASKSKKDEDDLARRIRDERVSEGDLA